MFQEREVDRIADGPIKDDIESGLTTYNMKVTQAKKHEEEITQLDAQENTIDQEQGEMDH